MDPRVENNADRLSKSHRWFDIAAEAFEAGHRSGVIAGKGEADFSLSEWLKEPHDD